jgi:hypothetical protein
MQCLLLISFIIKIKASEEGGGGVQGSLRWGDLSRLIFSWWPKIDFVLGREWGEGEAWPFLCSIYILNFFLFFFSGILQYLFVVSVLSKHFAYRGMCLILTTPLPPFLALKPSGFEWSKRGWSEPVFVNLLWSPGIDSQPGGPVRQPYLSYRPAMLQRLAESNPRNRFLVSLNVYKYGLCSSPTSYSPSPSLKFRILSTHTAEEEMERVASKGRRCAFRHLHIWEAFFSAKGWLVKELDLGSLDINLSQLSPLSSVAVPARHAGYIGWRRFQPM